MLWTEERYGPAFLTYEQSKTLDRLYSQFVLKDHSAKKMIIVPCQKQQRHLKGLVVEEAGGENIPGHFNAPYKR